MAARTSSKKFQTILQSEKRKNFVPHQYYSCLERTVPILVFLHAKMFLRITVVPEHRHTGVTHQMTVNVMTTCWTTGVKRNASEEQHKLNHDAFTCAVATTKTNSQLTYRCSFRISKHEFENKSDSVLNTQTMYRELFECDSIKFSNSVATERISCSYTSTIVIRGRSQIISRMSGEVVVVVGGGGGGGLSRKHGLKQSRNNAKHSIGRELARAIGSK